MVDLIDLLRDRIAKEIHAVRAHRELVNHFWARKEFSIGTIEGLNNKAKVTMIMRTVFLHSRWQISRAIVCFANYASQGSPTAITDEPNYKRA